MLQVFLRLCTRYLIRQGDDRIVNVCGHPVRKSDPSPQTPTLVHDKLDPRIQLDVTSAIHDGTDLRPTRCRRVVTDYNYYSIGKVLYLYVPDFGCCAILKMPPSSEKCWLARLKSGLSRDVVIHVPGRTLSHKLALYNLYHGSQETA